jgi:predicted anti-sigma-YlaC factor YlaD
MKNSKTNCTEMREKLEDLLLDPTAVPARVQTHVAECDGCKAELAELKATMALLDEWEAPEPSPYFVSKLNARMREERAAAPTGWLASRIARMRAAFAYGSVAPAKPLAAMALTLMLFIGGGTYLGVTDWNHPAQATTDTAVVQDLQLLDNNAQLLDQLESISDNNGGD